LLFLGHLKGLIVKRRYAQGWNFGRNKSSRANFIFCLKRGVALILWENRSATTGYTKTPSQSANSILEDWVTMIAMPRTY
jgi:hypothetical protein